jgi:ParB family chromosome partitioning protein
VMPEKIELEKIRVPEWARRTVLDGKVIDEIAESIETYGQLNPVIVRDLGDGNYELIAGYQRYLAMRKRGRSKIEAKVVKCTDEEALALSIEENLKRAEEHPFDVAKKVAYMHDVLGMSEEKIANKLGRDKPWVSKMLKINAIDEEAKKVLAPKVRDIEKLYAIAKFDDPEKQRIAADLLAKRNLSREDVEDLAKKANSMSVEEFRAYCERRLKEEGEGHEERVKEAGGVAHAQPPRIPEMPLAQGSQAGGAQPAEQPSDQRQPPVQGPRTGQEQRKGPETYRCNLCREEKEGFKTTPYRFCSDRHEDLHRMLLDLKGLPPDEIDLNATILREVNRFLLDYPKEQRAEMAKGIAEIAPYLKGLDLEQVKEVVEEVKRRFAQN